MLWKNTRCHYPYGHQEFQLICSLSVQWRHTICCPSFYFLQAVIVIWCHLFLFLAIMYCKSCQGGHCGNSLEWGDGHKKQRSAGRGIFPVPPRPVVERDGTRKLRSREGRDRTGQFQKIRGTGRERKFCERDGTVIKPFLCVPCVPRWKRK